MRIVDAISLPRAFIRLPLIWGLLLSLALSSLGATPEIWFYKDTENGTGMVLSMTAFPGETIHGRVASFYYDLTNRVVHVSIFFQGQMIAETNGLARTLEAPFSLTLQEGEYFLSAIVEDSTGQLATNRAPIRVSNNRLQILVDQPGPIVAGDPVPVEVTSSSAAPMEGLSLTSDGVSPGSGPITVSSSTPSRTIWTPPNPGKYYLRGYASLQSSGYSYIYQATSGYVTVLPTRLPYVLGVWVPPQPAGGSLTIEPTILSRDVPRVQWFRDGQEIPGANSISLTLSNLNEGSQGQYSVHVENFAGATSADVATVTVTNAPPSGGALWFSSRTPNVNVQIRESLPDGRLLDAESRAQLYAGRSVMEMKPVGPVLSFHNGYFIGGAVQVPNVAPGEYAYVQVAVWDNASPTFDQRGGANWWRSKILQLTTTATEAGGAELVGLEPFGLMIWDGYSLAASIGAPAEQTVSLGSTLNLIAQGGAFYTWTGVRVTNVFYQWSKDGRLLAGMTESNVVKSTLTLTNLQRADAGIYRVTITDGVDIKTVAANVIVDTGQPILGMSPTTNGEPNWRVDMASGTTTIKTSFDLVNWVDLQKSQVTNGGPSTIWLSNIFSGLSQGFVKASTQ